jgi:hypothetical protein
MVDILPHSEFPTRHDASKTVKSISAYYRPFAARYAQEFLPAPGRRKCSEQRHHGLDHFAGSSVRFMGAGAAIAAMRDLACAMSPRLR